MKLMHAILAATLFSSALLPIQATAGSAVPASYDLATRQTDTDAAGEYDGRLRIKVSSDGIVAGTYMDTEGYISTVAGGVDGTKIWLDLRAASPGTSRHLQRHLERRDAGRDSISRPAHRDAPR